MIDSPVRLTLDRSVRRFVIAEAEAAYPEECCGVLLGERSVYWVEVRQAVATRNAAKDRRKRFEIPPEEILAATRRGRGSGLEIVGYYHSHPGGAAEPSDADLRAAWSATTYLILAVEDRSVRELRSWEVAEAGEGFAEQVVDGEPIAEQSTAGGESELTTG